MPSRYKANFVDILDYTQAKYSHVVITDSNLKLHSQDRTVKLVDSVIQGCQGVN